MCKKIPKVEWSGPLFYTHEGSITKPDEFKITVKDILPLDMGSAAFTSYKNDDRFVDYMIEDPERLDWNMGHCHSHNVMAVFFSGVDTDELVDNAPCYNFYVSLIVNNYGDMVARVAFETTVDYKVNNIPQWATDEDGKKFIFKKEKDIITKKYIYYYDCEIISSVELITVDDTFAARVTKIMEPKKPVIPITTYPAAYQQNAAYKAPAYNGNATGKKRDFKEFSKNLASQADFKTHLATSTAQEDAIEQLLITLFSFGDTYEPDEFTLDYVIEDLEEKGFHEDPIAIADVVVRDFGDEYGKMFPTATADEFAADLKACIEVLADLIGIYPYIRVTVKGLELLLSKFLEPVV